MAAAVASGTTSISNPAKDTASGPGSARDSAVSPASRRTPVINGYEDGQQHSQQIHLHRVRKRCFLFHCLSVFLAAFLDI